MTGAAPAAKTRTRPATWFWPLSGLPAGMRQNEKFLHRNVVFAMLPPAGQRFLGLCAMNTEQIEYLVGSKPLRSENL